MTSKRKRYLVDELDLSIRLTLCLDSRGINYLDELTQYTEKEISWWAGMGKKTLEELLKILDKKKLRLIQPETTTKLRRIIPGSIKEDERKD